MVYPDSWPRRLIFFFFLLTACSVSERKPPNHSLVMVTIDTLRADRLGAAGNPLIKTPNLDRLAKRATQFCRAHCEIPLTLPSHAGLMTSVHPRDIGFLTNRGSLDPEHTTVAEMLAQHEFRTAAFTTSILSLPCGMEQGFEFYTLQEAEKTGYEKIKTLLSVPDGVATQGIDEGETLFASAQKRVGEAIDWLSMIERQRYFLWLHVFEPHLSYQPLPPYDRIYTNRWIGSDGNLQPYYSLHTGGRPLTPDEIRILRALYNGEVSIVDQELGRLFRILAMRPQDNPLLIVTADHGEMLYEKNRFFGHGKYLYEEMLKIPLLICDDLTSSNGTLSEQPAALTDVVPTALHRLDLPPLPHARGQNLLDPASAKQDTTTIFTLNRSQEGISDGRYKLIRDRTQNSWEIYDLHSDPGENQPLSEQNQAEIRVLKHRLDLLQEPSEHDSAAIPESRRQALETLGYVS